MVRENARVWGQNERRLGGGKGHKRQLYKKRGGQSSNLADDKGKGGLGLIRERGGSGERGHGDGRIKLCKRAERNEKGNLLITETTNRRLEKGRSEAAPS